jgi:hypothetical protein
MLRNKDQHPMKYFVMDDQWFAFRNIGDVLLILPLQLTNANHAFPAMPDGRDRSSIAFL